VESGDLNNLDREEILKTDAYDQFQKEINDRVTDGTHNILLEIPIRNFLHRKSLELTFDWQTEDSWEILINETKMPLKHSSLNNLSYIQNEDSFIYSKKDLTNYSNEKLIGKTVAFIDIITPDSLENSYTNDQEKRIEYPIHLKKDLSLYFVSSTTTHLSIDLSTLQCGDDIINHKYSLALRDLDGTAIFKQDLLPKEDVEDLGIIETTKNQILKLELDFPDRYSDCIETEKILINSNHLVTTDLISTTEETILYTKPNIEFEMVYFQNQKTHRVLLSKNILETISFDSPALIYSGNYSFSKSSYFNPFKYQEINTSALNFIRPEYTITGFEQTPQFSRIVIPNDYIYNYEGEKSLHMELINKTLLEDYNALKNKMDYGYEYTGELRNTPITINNISWSQK
jgi:hypothetical protein